VPIAHATPAGFCVNNSKRGDMNEIVSDYLKLRFDVMLGGGIDNFNAAKRSDKRDMISEFKKAGFAMLQTRAELMSLSAQNNQPVMGVFNEGALPYALDRENDASLKERTPSLAEMAKFAINRLSKNKNGFVMQIEGGKVDWAAHANDAPALVYDQIAFDEAVKVAIDFASTRNDTLVIITTDHGNANPGLFYGSDADKNFERLMKVKQTNEWFLMGMNRNYTTAQVIERLETAQGYAITDENAKEILSHYANLNEDGVYNSYKLPYKPLGIIQQKYYSIGWGAMEHSGDFVELAMYGPGSEMLKPLVKNYELHHFMLRAAGIKGNVIV
jgi:alkaline phosphatase